MLLLTAFIARSRLSWTRRPGWKGPVYLSYLIRVVVPLTRPALLIAFLYGLLGVWNDIIGPVVLLADPSLFPVTKGHLQLLRLQRDASGRCWRPAIVIASLPVVLLFAVSQRQIIRTAIAGAVKG